MANSGRGPNQQNFTYNDGNTYVSYSSQSFSWGSSQQGTPPAQNDVPVSLQQLHSNTIPQMPSLPDFGQIHQQHMDLHNAGIQAAMQMQQNAMQSAMQPFQYQQPALMPAMQQPQGQMQAPMPPAQLLAPPSEPLRIQVTAHDSSDEDKYDARAAARERDARAAERDREARTIERDTDDRAAERDRQMLGVAQKIENRMQRSDQRCQELAEAQAKNEAGLQARHEQSAREQREMMQQLQYQMAVLQSQVSTPQPASPAIDMGALQKIISEGGAEQISKADIKQLIDDAVSKQLSGVARSSDLELAASRMERNLHKVAGASNAQVAQQVQRELTSAISQVERHMDTRQQRIAASQHQHKASPQSNWSQVQTHFTIEELPNDDEQKRTPTASSHCKSKALPAPREGIKDWASQIEKPPHEATAMQTRKVQPQNMIGSTNDSISAFQPQVNQPVRGLGSQGSNSRTSDMPMEGNAVARVKQSSDKPSRSSKTSSVSVQPSERNALVLPRVDKVPEPDSKPGRSSKISTVSVQPSESNAIVRFKAVPAPTPGLGSSWAPSNPTVAPPQLSAERDKKPKMSTVSVQPSDQNALVRAKARTSSSKTSTVPMPLTADQNGIVGPAQIPQIAPAAVQSRSSKMSTISVQPSKNNALIRASAADADKHDSKEKKLSKKSAMSIQPSSSSAMVRSSRSSEHGKTSSTQAITTSSGFASQVNAYGGEGGLRNLPDAFPDNASQITALEKRRDSKAATQKLSTVGSRQPRNDHRGQLAGPSPLRQLENV